MNLVGDGLHNFIDGLIIVGGYLVSIPAGIATTIAVLLHEIPQEIGDFGILVHGGFTKWKALLLNFLSAVFAILGALFALWIGNYVNNVENILVSIAIGGFIYIAGSDLIPELHKESHSFMKSLLQAFVFVLGILVMYALLLFG
jgi:zinc and cadmium transporter